MLFQEEDLEKDRVVEKEEEKPKSGWFSRSKKKNPETKQTPPLSSAAAPEPQNPSVAGGVEEDDGLPPRLESVNVLATKLATGLAAATESDPDLPARAGFDLRAIREVIDEADRSGRDLEVPMASPLATALGRSDPTQKGTLAASGVMLLSPRPEVEARSPPAAGEGYLQHSPTDSNPREWTHPDQLSNAAGSQLTFEGEDGRVVLGMESWEGKVNSNPWAMGA
jgi:hypothetical protein